MTTTTTVVSQQWTLEKYSRSRSSPTLTDPIEWDHYSQPKLVVRIEATYDSTLPVAPAAAAPPVTPLPIKLLFQVTYDPLYRDRDLATPGSDSNANASTVTLDSIDFVRFSAREYRHATPSDQLPLKAVYKDSILGIRYLALPQRSGTNSALPPQQQQPQEMSEFRRVQLKFESTREREKFVDAIRGLVPVKPAAEPAIPAAAASSSTAKGKKRAGSEAASQATPPVSSKKRKKRNETQQYSHVAPQQRDADPSPVTGTALRPTASSSQYVATPPSQPSHVRNTITGPYGPPARNSTQIFGDPNPYLAPAGSSYYPASRQQQQREPPVRLPQGLASLLPNLANSSARPAAMTNPFSAHPNEDEGAPPPPNVAPSFRTASLALTALAPEDLDRLLRETLFEEGFDEFVHTVKETLVQR